MSKKTAITNYIYAALFAALIFTATRFLQLPMPVISGGYIHLGDAMLYLAASVLPFPFAVYASAIGGALSDATSAGYLLWAPFTLVIKPLMTLCFTSKKETLLCAKNLWALILAALVNLVGYYAAEAVLYGNLLSPVASIPYNLLQSAGSGVLFLLAAAALDKLKFKEYLRK